MEFLAKNRIKTKNFVFVPLKADLEHGIQEFYQKPSIQALKDYFRKSERLSPEQKGLCQALLARNKGLDGETVSEAFSEFEQFYLETRLAEYISPSNVLVLGRVGKKLLLALVDF